MADVRCLNDAHGDNWTAYLGDSCDVVTQLPEKSVHLSVYSPPFSGIYIYNDSEADMGNCADDAEFMEHYRFLVGHLHRITKPGRICAVHCKDLVYYRNQRGTAGLRDFPGDLIRAHTEAGFDFHSRITVWRCPLREMTKTKAHGLLYKQLRADSTFSRQGLPEYFLLFRKWAGEDEPVEPVTHTFESFPLDRWQEWASPVWMQTRETDVLHADGARQPNDERHICPMPLDLTARIVTMYSNPGDVVLSPFMGIGSEGVVALRQRRKFVGVELKESYFTQACRYLRSEDAQFNDLFSQAAE
jgi:hypothetical protein